MPGRGRFWKVGGLNDEHIKEEDLTQALQTKVNSGGGQAVHIMGTSAQISISAGLDNVWSWNCAGFNTIISRVEIPSADAFTFSRLTIHIFANSSTGGQSKFVLMINGSVANSEVIIPAQATGTFQDLVNTDSIASGDRIAIKYIADQATGGTIEPKGYSYVSS